MESSCFNETYIARLQEGDPLAGEHFVSYFRVPVRLKASRHLRAPDLVDDACQETLLRVLRHFRSGKRLESADRLPAFVFSVCHNVAMEVLRVRARHPQISPTSKDPVDSTADPQREIVTEERRRLVLGILAQLPDKDRELLRLAILEETNRPDLCARFGANEKYLRVLLHRARRRFRAALLKTQSTAA